MKSWNIYNQVNRSTIIQPTKKTDVVQEVRIKFVPTHPGHVVFHAQNEIGSSSIFGIVQIGEIEEPFAVGVFPEYHTIAEGDSISIECGAITYNCLYTLLWTKNGRKIEKNDPRYSEISTQYSLRKTISWRNITKRDEGTYQCEVHGCMNKSRTVTLKVNEAKVPTITSNFNQTTMLHSMGDTLIVNCTVTGLPIPILIWYKNGHLFEVKQMNHSIRQDIVMSPDNSSITFNYLKVEDSGKYVCRAKSRINSDEKQFELIIEGNDGRFDSKA